MKANDKVLYNAGDSRGSVEATVTKVNKDDGSIDLLYPHPADPEVLANAERVRPGQGAYQFRAMDEATDLPVADPLAAALEEIDRLKVTLNATEAKNLELEKQIADAAKAAQAPTTTPPEPGIPPKASDDKGKAS